MNETIIKKMELVNRLARKLLKKEITRNPTLQEFFFRKSLKEVGIKDDEIKIDHIHGTCWHRETGIVPIIFPDQWVNEVRSFSRLKTQDYFFRGTITPDRQWIKEYSNVESSDYGRDVKKKYKLDKDYFSTLCASRFGLAPVGDCPWSYRFFETIMCDAIPVIGEFDEDIFSTKFYTTRHNKAHEYSENKCQENYLKFVKCHTLKGIFS